MDDKTEPKPIEPNAPVEPKLKGETSLETAGKEKKQPSLAESSNGDGFRPSFVSSSSDLDRQPDHPAPLTEPPPPPLSAEPNTEKASSPTPVPEDVPAIPEEETDTPVSDVSELISPIFNETGEGRLPESPLPEVHSTPSSKTRSSGINTQSRTILWLTAPIILLALGVFILSIIHPEIVSILVRAGVTLIFVVFVIFIVLGVFIVFGLRSEAQSLLSLLFEGGVKYIDIAEQASRLWDRFVILVKEMILTISPLLAAFLAALFYYLVMFSFRVIGMNGDVTLFTVFLTVGLACVTAVLGMMNVGSSSEDDLSFNAQFGRKFGRVFVDGVEIAVLAIFLTIDIPNLVFLPKSLHGTITAEAFGYDFMERGFHSDIIRITTRLAGAAVFTEVVRKVYKIISSARQHFKRLKTEIEIRGIQVTTLQQTFEIVRHAIRRAFRDSIDDMTKFLGFTTILVFAFFFFPMLKMLSLLFFNLTNLVWDILVPKRLMKTSSSEDLFSRILVKVLRLDTKTTST